MFNHTDYFLAMLADEKIAEARTAAADVRLALRTGSARRQTYWAVWSRLVGLFRALARVFGRGRPAVETTVPAGRAR